MRLQFLGAAGTVTGSKTLLENTAGQRVLMDCGLFQGLKRLRLKNWEPFPVSPQALVAVILTHAHLDHSGSLPILVRGGFGGPIYCTEATRELCRIMLLDSAMIMEEEAAYANRKGFSKHKPALPLYTSEDVERTLRLFETVPLHRTKAIAGFAFELGRAGHILGAANARIESDGVSVHFSGDVGRPNDALIRDPEPLRPADYLVLESTYGDRLHPAESPEKLIASIVEETVRRRGSVLIPAFAVGRAQFLLFTLSELKRKGLIPDLPVFLDSPMAINVLDLYREHREDHRLSLEQCRQMCASATYVRTADESKQLTARADSRIIVSASGMATGGRVLHHLKAMAGSSANSIVLSGFQAAGTRGASLLAGAKELKIHGAYVPVHARVFSLESFSAHADYAEMLAWLNSSAIRPKRCFLTHGEPAASDALRVRIRDELGWDVLVPEEDQVQELSGTSLDSPRASASCVPLPGAGGEAPGKMAVPGPAGLG